MKPAGTHWNDKLDEELKERRALGESARQIADAMRIHSRNAVIGRLHRLGVTSGDRHAPKPARPRRPLGQKSPRPDMSLYNRQRRSGMHKSTRAIYGDWATDKTRQTPPQGFRDDLPPSPNQRACQIDELTSTNCHWPCGDPREPGFFFCGAAKPADGFPYCDHHHARAYTPAKRMHI